MHIISGFFILIYFIRDRDDDADATQSLHFFLDDLESSQRSAHNGSQT